MRENEEVKIYTSIKSDFYRRKMLKGIITALLGLFVIGYGVGFVTPENLYLLGLPILLLGAVLIIGGLMPLRRLTKLEQNPHELIVEKEYVHYVINSHPVFTIPVKEIREFCYMEKSGYYGLAFFLKDKNIEALIIHKPHFNMARFIEKSQKKTGADLFLPYFRRRSISRLGFLKNLEPVENRPKQSRKSTNP